MKQGLGEQDLVKQVLLEQDLVAPVGGDATRFLVRKNVKPLR